MIGHAQRKPIVYLFVILPILIGGAIGLIIALVEIYSYVTGLPRYAIPRLNGVLITLPALFLWIPISLLIGNRVLYSLPPLRRIAEKYAAQAGRPGFMENQTALLKALGAIALVCIPLILLGFML